MYLLEVCQLKKSKLLIHKYKYMYMAWIKTEYHTQLKRPRDSRISHSQMDATKGFIYFSLSVQ